MTKLGFDKIPVPFGRLTRHPTSGIVRLGIQMEGKACEIFDYSTNLRKEVMMVIIAYSDLLHACRAWPLVEERDSMLQPILLRANFSSFCLRFCNPRSFHFFYFHHPFKPVYNSWACSSKDL